MIPVIPVSWWLASVLADRLAWPADVEYPLLGAWFSFTLVMTALLFAVPAVATRLRRRQVRRRNCRLSLFARRNGFSYSAQARADTRANPGLIFPDERTTYSIDRFRSKGAGRVPFEVANFRGENTDGQGTHATYSAVHGYLCVVLGRPLPHIILDASGNGSLRSIGLFWALPRARRLSLEGDFDRHFTLYCASDYERDALEILTPDLMAVLIDEASNVDLEIVDDRLYLYTAAPWDFLDPSEWARILHLVQAVVPLTGRRTARYRDPRGDRSATATPDGPPRIE